MNSSGDNQDYSYEPIEVIEQETEESKRKHKKGIIRDIVIYIIVLFLCVRVVPQYVIQHTIVDGASMENNLDDRDHLMVEKISYRLDQLKRFDIIAFYPYGREVEEYYIKRIIALPNETVQIKGSDIYINNELLEENFGKDPITYAGIAAEPITLGDDEYFVLGDNRAISLDSRSDEVGIVHKDQIGGRAILRIWPLNKFGTLE